MKINGGKKDKTKCYLTEGGETVAGGLAGLGTAGPAGMVIGGAAGAAHALELTLIVNIDVPPLITFDKRGLLYKFSS